VLTAGVYTSVFNGGRTEAEKQLSAVGRLMGIAEELGEDPQAVAELRVQIATGIKADHKAGLGLPEFEAIRRAVLTGQPIVERLTVQQWLAQWLADKKNLSANTRRIYASHLQLYPIPNLGRIPLERLRVAHLTAMFDAITADVAAREASNAERRAVMEQARAAWHRQDLDAWQQARERLAALPPFGRPCHAASRSRIRATLRSALSAACSQQLITINVAALAEIPSGRTPKALVWTPERVACWQATGEKPSPVMVWTPEQTQVFLERAVRHELRAAYFVLTYTALRRGEAVGLRWQDVDLPARMLTVSQQVVQLGWETRTTGLKTAASGRRVGLAAPLRAELEAHRTRQDGARAAAGAAWHDTGLVFTTADGTGIHPDQVSHQFRALARQAGLPPVRLHDLRHGAASIALAAGVDLKVVSDMLGHSSTAFTADVYTSVFTSLKRQAAEAIAHALTQAAPAKAIRQAA
jgi:integrase